MRLNLTDEELEELMLSVKGRMTIMSNLVEAVLKPEKPPLARRCLILASLAAKLAEAVK